jgi:hypothetical protein
VRICSFLPSATEIIAELGLVESLVGVSEECRWPTEVVGLPVATAARIEPSEAPKLWDSGVQLDEGFEPNAPGPDRGAAVSLADGTPFVVIEHYAHPDEFLELRARAIDGSPHETTARFADAVGLDPTARKMLAAEPATWIEHVDRRLRDE